MKLVSLEGKGRVRWILQVATMMWPSDKKDKIKEVTLSPTQVCILWPSFFSFLSVLILNAGRTSISSMFSECLNWKGFQNPLKPTPHPLRGDIWDWGSGILTIMYVELRVIKSYQNLYYLKMVPLVFKKVLSCWNSTCSNCSIGHFQQVGWGQLYRVAQSSDIIYQLLLSIWFEWAVDINMLAFTSALGLEGIHFLLMQAHVYHAKPITSRKNWAEGK